MKTRRPAFASRVAIKSAQLDAARSLWSGLLAQVGSAGIDSVILACTDLNAVSETEPGGPGGLKVLDATECLARATVRRWRAGGAHNSE